MIMQRQVLQSLSDPVPRRRVVPQLQFNDSVFFLAVNRDRNPQQFQFLDKVVCRPGLCNDRFRCSCVQYICRGKFLCRGCLRSLLEEFYTFPTSAHCSRLETWTLSLRAPCIWQPLLLCFATVNGSFWTYFLCFYVKSELRS